MIDVVPIPNTPASLLREAERDVAHLRGIIDQLAVAGAHSELRKLGILLQRLAFRSTPPEMR